MDYNQSDSSGTDDDLPPSHSGRVVRGGRISGNRRGSIGRTYGRPQPPNIQDLIYKLEQDAYTAVLRAFGAQSEAITWAKERLMTDLRKELRISDEQHREFLGRVAGDDTLRQIHGWRQFEDEPRGLANAPPDPSPSPAISQSLKRHKSAQAPQSSFPPPPPAPLLLPAPVPSSGPSAAPRRGATAGQRGRKTKGARQPPMVTVPNVPAVGGPSTSRSSNLGKGPASEINKAAGTSSDLLIDSWIGRRVKTRWPEDNTFYEAVVSDYNSENGKHALVYDMNTDKETWEWVNLKEMLPSDLKLVEGPLVSVGGKVPPTGAAPSGRGGGGRGGKRSGGPRGGVASSVGRARGALKLQTASTEKLATPNPQTRPLRGSATVENSQDRKGLHSAGLPPLEDLMKEVDKLEEEDDLAKLESAKRAAKEHEEAIRKALAEVGESSDEAGSDDGGHLPSHTQSMEHARGHRSRPDTSDRNLVSEDEDNTARDDRGEGSDGEPMTGEGGGVSIDDDEQQPADGDEKDEDG
ncbi:hypothetical protein O6H91_09G046400 [Diphasiastrum complanatum]|uniref:Uncharacterized protein n=1 Tax=Diphasiastrum complanatum TaxID=34168 RepID=A0ACC2CNP2_DIPCM|nr:hypothetical protein O6H91_09G046400 [Diphasiastrum complanatum]